ncbi:MAG: serine/threonine phosphatase PrpC, regulation of stationary phase [Myxococcaceae bacterium]|nr:serine/threonine phosphatase PrpC, regulation of stationary phase [Myxococcaceae bacterium]
MSENPSVYAWAETHVGRVRDHNEDAFLVEDSLSLYAVADGMGGHAAGEVASQLALETLSRVVGEGKGRLDELVRDPSSKPAARDILRLLEDAALLACNVVHEAGQADEQKRGMGTTLSVLLIVASQGFIAHVGDSRIYLLRGDKSYQLTQDHTLQNELLKRGKLTPAQVSQVKQKNALIRAIGVYASVEVDTLRFDVFPGDRFMLCSDGLHAYLQKDELSKIFEGAIDQAAQRLVALANQRGGHDNITALVISTQAARVSERPNLAQLKLETLRVATLFRFLNYQELVKVANLTDVRSFVPDEPIFQEGTEGDELFVVLSGRVRVRKGGAVIVELGPGEHFGEMALLDRGPRSASVSALEATRVLAMKRRDFLGIVKHDRDLGVKLLWQFLGVLTERLRNTSRELGEARGQLALGLSDMLELDDEELENNP